MRKLIRPAVSAGLTLAVLCGVVLADPAQLPKQADVPQETTESFAEDHVVMSVAPDFSVAAVESRAEVKAAIYLYGTDDSDFYRVDLKHGFTAEDVVDELSDIPSVNYVELDGIVETSLAGTSAYDYYQWHHDVIHTQSAWNQMQKLPKLYKTRVAIIDGYINPNEDDIILALNTTLSRHVIKGVVKTPRWNAPRCDHANLCASIIAADPNDGNGVKGIACGPGGDLCELVAIGLDEVTMTAMDEPNFVTFYSSLAAGIKYAADAKCRVISISLGTQYPSKLIEDAVTYATRKGSLCVCSSGNRGDSVKNYPGSYPDAVAVANLRLNSSGLLERAGSSSYNDVEISAPGTDIRAKNAVGRTQVVEGTSASAPMVASAVSLLLSIDPTLSSRQAYDIVRQTCHDVGAPGNDIYTGCGCINCDAAVRYLVSQKYPQYLIVGDAVG